ncbi:peptidase U32 family protein [Desulfonatronum thioautotrophicum]|uniref:peptidase U32 family protein n=1 Tax=Desulfonatronum thioautotrophicum TaxID=617001 RepID=UPI0005EAEBF1|nr:peptidase U32 family protein [Desulfonatronum thioautotrophicum]
MSNTPPSRGHVPEILAPAGDRQAFLAALAAGADAVYCGLKHFSARMEAENFSLAELADLTRLAHAKGRRVLVAMNTLVKPGDLAAAGRLVDQLQRHVQPDGLIVQDLGLLALAGQCGFSGELHLSTLACVTPPVGLSTAARLGIRQVVLPRELHLDEIKQMAAACPPEMHLEVFVHGALCYAVSGRCYWSSYMGGKSGLRGRCVQPCRRRYAQEGRRGGFFSCQDLSLDVLVKTLLDIPQVRTWKIEGRKKSAHYVFYTVTAYRLLRDEAASTRSRKEAAALLEMALGRPGSHAGFLPQRRYIPLAPDSHLGSGMLAGHVPKDAKTPFIRPRVPLLPGDLLRLGTEDQPWHRVIRVTRPLPKGGRFDLAQGPGRALGKNTGRASEKGTPQSPDKGHVINQGRHKAALRRMGQGMDRGSALPPPGTPVWLIDRREPELQQLLRQLEQEAAEIASDRPDRGESPIPASQFLPVLSEVTAPLTRSWVMRVSRRPLRRDKSTTRAMWLDPKFLEHMNDATCRELCWWLPPVIWPEEEQLWIDALIRVRGAGATLFVCNAPWQAALFETPPTMQPAHLQKAIGEAIGRATPTIRLWAGPFCNTANALALEQLALLGFAGAVVSPELDEQAFLDLPQNAPLPLGLVTAGFWPLCVSRWRAEELRVDTPVVSPKEEVAWVREYGPDLWVYPDWSLDVRPHLPRLESAGYRLFVELEEKLPAGLTQRPRTSPFNWNLRLL